MEINVFIMWVRNVSPETFILLQTRREVFYILESKCENYISALNLLQVSGEHGWLFCYLSAPPGNKVLSQYCQNSLKPTNI